MDKMHLLPKQSKPPSTESRESLERLVERQRQIVAAQLQLLAASEKLLEEMRRL